MNNYNFGLAILIGVLFMALLLMKVEEDKLPCTDQFMISNWDNDQINCFPTQRVIHYQLQDQWVIGCVCK